MKKHGQAWNYVATVSSMSSSHEDASMSLARRIVDALAAGDGDEALRLTRELERALASAPESALGSAPSFTAQPAVVPMTRTPVPGRSARQVVAGALAEIGVVTWARVVTDHAGARSGRRAEPRTLAALRRDERRASDKSSARPTSIVPALEARYFQPVRGLLTLSDWPLERRLIGPWSERADHLAATAQLEPHVILV